MPGGIEGEISFTVPGQSDRYVVYKLTGATLNTLEFAMIGHGLPPRSRGGAWCDHGTARITELADGSVYIVGNPKLGASDCAQWLGTLKSST
jgi:hypothetical protein